MDEEKERILHVNAGSLWWNYEKQYGRNGTGAKNARQDLIHDYIQRVIGTQTEDKVLIGDLPYIGNFMVKYGW